MNSITFNFIRKSCKNRLSQKNKNIFFLNIMYVVRLEPAISTYTATVVPTKSDSDVMFCLQSYHGLIIDRSLVYYSYPQDRINTHVIYRLALAQVKCTS